MESIQLYCKFATVFGMRKVGMTHLVHHLAGCLKNIKAALSDTKLKS